MRRSHFSAVIAMPVKANGPGNLPEKQPSRKSEFFLLMAFGEVKVFILL
jgi:hypothetical protein